MSNPTMSFGAKTFLLEATGRSEGGLTRRQFLEKSLVVAGGVAFLSVALEHATCRDAKAEEQCHCYSNCYNNCHSDCGRKMW